MGWAWWPMKKVAAVAGPLSITKNPGYQTLLDYWSNGGTTPTSAFAKTALMQLAEDLKIENCRYQKDVTDALFRQVYYDETIPFATNAIPGVVYAPDYDLGVIGEAYYDSDAANYSVTTGNYTAWNNGWSYRNDGVDIETSSDKINSNGFNIGFMETDEWMQYEVNIAKTGVYDIHVRAASGGSGGRMHFAAGDADITPTSFIGPTGGWQNWETTVIKNVVLDASDKKIRFYVDQAGFNLGSFEWIESSVDMASIATKFVAAVTVDEYSIRMNTNKFIATPLPSSPSDFEIFVDGESIPISAVSVDTDNPRILHFALDYILKSTDDIKISYAGNEVLAEDASALAVFTLENVTNTLEFVHQIPTKIKAEDFDYQEGIVLETTTDDGGGENVGYLDPNDYLDYEVNVTKAGTYNVDFRTAAQYGTGGLQLQFLDTAKNVTVISSPSFQSTGDWQNWNNTRESVTLPVGRYTMRLLITQSPFNMNWVQFTDPTSSIDAVGIGFANFNVYPNPSKNLFKIQAEMVQNQDVMIHVLNVNGQLIQSSSLENTSVINEQISLDNYPAGFYFLTLRLEDGSSYSTKLIKTNH
jgi:hypothetical protein